MKAGAHRGFGQEALQDVQPVGLDDGDFVREAPEDERAEEEDEQLRAHDTATSLWNLQLSRRPRDGVIELVQLLRTQAAC